MRNRQTCTVGDLNLILALVALLDAQPIYVVGEMIGCTVVEVPMRFIVAVVEGGGVAGTAVFGLICLVETVSAGEGLVTPVVTYLTTRTNTFAACAVSTTTLTATTAPSLLATAAMSLLAAVSMLTTATPAVALMTTATAAISLLATTTSRVARTCHRVS